MSKKKAKTAIPQMSETGRLAQEAFLRATWKAIQGYRITGELVPDIDKEGNVIFRTVDNVLRSRPDYKIRMKEDRERKRRALIEELASAGQKPSDYGL